MVSRRAQAETSAPRAASDGTGSAAQGRSSPRAPRTRRIVTWVLVILASLLIPVAVISVWAIRTVTNTDQYVATMAPLARNQVIVEHLAQKATDELFSTHIVENKVTAVLPPKAKPIVTPIVAEVHTYVYGIALTVFESPKFGQLWDTLNRHTHDAVVDILTGKQTPITKKLEKGGGIVVNVTPALNNVINEANAKGVTLFNPLKPILSQGNNLGVTVVSKSQVSEFSGFFNLIVTLKWVIPVVALVLAILGIVIAVDHRKTLLRIAIGVALVTLILLAGLSLGRITFINQAGHTFNRQVAADVWDTMLRSSRPICAGRCSWRPWLPWAPGWLDRAAWPCGSVRHVSRGALDRPAGARADVGHRPNRGRIGPFPARRCMDPRPPQRTTRLRPRHCRPLPRLRRQPDRMEPPCHRHRARRVPRIAPARRRLGQQDRAATHTLRNFLRTASVRQRFKIGAPIERVLHLFGSEPLNESPLTG